MQVDSLQLWPVGTMVSVTGDGDDMRVKYGTDSDFRPPTAEERRAIEVERYAQRIMDQDVLCVDSSLVDDMLKAASAGELSRDMVSEWCYEDITNLYTDADSMDYDECVEWLKEHGHEIDDENKPHVRIEYDEAYTGGNYDGVGEEALIPEDKCDDWNDSEKVYAVFEKETGYERVNIVHYSPDESYDADGNVWDEDDATESLRDEVRNNAEPAEIYEWWRVNKWLASRLDEIGECVLTNAYGQWWGRTCTGQSMQMDGTFQRVASLVIRQ